MNILAIPATFGYSNPVSGGQNRFSNLLDELFKKENCIYLLEANSVIDSKDSINFNVFSYNELSFCGRMLSIFRDITPSYIVQIRNILKNEQIDLIQITHPSGAFIIKLLCFIYKMKIPIVYDAHNVESHFIKETFLLSQRHSFLEHILVFTYTRLLDQIAIKYWIDYVNTVSLKDRDVFIQEFGINPDKIDVIPSGCHIKNTHSSKSQCTIRNDFGINSDTIIIFFHGSFTHPPNRKAFEIIQDLIAPSFEQRKNILFLVGGSKFPKFVEKNIVSLGFIDNLYDVLSIADIAIVPLKHGAGTKLKIFDYFSVGLPVITTKKGIEGIEAINNEHAVILDDIDQYFIDAINNLIENEFDRRRIGLNGLKLAESKYEWGKIGEKLDICFKAYRTRVNDCETTAK